MYQEKKAQQSKACEIIVMSFMSGEIKTIDGLAIWLGYKKFLPEQSKLRDDILKRVNHPEIDEKNLSKIGNLGLMKALKNYDEKMSIDFYVFATRYIEAEIEDFLNSIL